MSRALNHVRHQLNSHVMGNSILDESFYTLWLDHLGENNTNSNETHQHKTDIVLVMMTR